MIRPHSATWLALVVVGLVAGQTKADYIIDLTKSGSSGSYQGALFQQTYTQPTGTGIFDPFVRIQRTGTERGYNTDARPVEFETKDQNQWTHSLLLGSLLTVDVAGMAYYRFDLDINETGTQAGRLLSMDDFRLYLGDSPSLSGWNDGFGTHSVKVYDLDAGGNNRVELNYKLNSGSGSGDMSVLVPVSLFQGQPSAYKYVYLYSAFGDPHGSDAGFEEWRALTGSETPPTTPVPAPPAAVLGLIGVGGWLGRRWTRRRAPAPAV